MANHYFQFKLIGYRMTSETRIDVPFYYSNDRRMASKLFVTSIPTDLSTLR